MYDLMPLFFCGIMFVLGLIMVINPKSSTKKELQNDAGAVAKTKKKWFYSNCLWCYCINHWNYKIYLK